ncbi:MAG: hypothetical protein WKF81_11700, partial [Thermomicrobiales bacterium]
MTDSTNDDIEIFLRPVAELSARMSILLSTGFRLVLETDSVEDSDEESYSAETERFERVAWLRATFGDTVAESELDMLGTPVGELSEDVADNHAFDRESALALGWVLGLADQLTGNQSAQVAIEALEDVAPRPWDRGDKLIKRFIPRSEEEVWAERERWYLVRLRGLADDVVSASERSALMTDILNEARECGLTVRNGDLDVA